MSNNYAQLTKNITQCRDAPLTVTAYLATVWFIAQALWIAHRHSGRIAISLRQY